MADVTAKFPASLAALADFGGEYVGLGENEWTANGATTAGAATPFSLVVNEAISARVPSAGWLTTANNEILHYNAVNAGTKTFTIDARAQQDTAAAAIDNGSAVGFWLTKRVVNQMLAEVIALETYFAPGGSVPTIASGATTDLSTVAKQYLQVTGTTTITAFGTSAQGVVKVLEFAGALTLTHNAASLILRSGENAKTAAGDVYAFVSEGSGNWRELWRLVAQNALVPYVYDRIVADTSFSNTAAEQTYYTKAIAGGVLGTTHQLRLRLIYEIDNATGASQTTAVLVKYGATMLCSFNMSLTNGNNRIVVVEVVLMAASATNAQRAMSHVIAGNTNYGTVDVAAVAATGAFGAAYAAAAEDSTASQNLVATVQMGAASPSLTTTLRQALLEFIP